MNKYHIRVPADQYAYLEAEFEGTSEEAVEEYRRLTKLVKGGPGLPDKEFNAILDKFAWEDKGDNGMEAEQYERMSDEQKSIIQAIKRSRKRIEYVSTKGNLHHSLMNEK